MSGGKWAPGPLHVNDSAHEHNAADPAFGVTATWIAAIRDENDDVIGNAEGETAEEAIERATYLAASPALADALEGLQIAVDTYSRLRGEGCVEHFGRQTQKARAALARAKGEE